jgi:hypothetical protein
LLCWAAKNKFLKHLILDTFIILTNLKEWTIIVFDDE